MDANQPAPPAPRRLGPYEICASVGSGGMASVFLARRTTSDGFRRAVAVKVIHPHLAAQAQLLERFFDEARIAARIHHANVCSILDFGDDSGVKYIAMEWLAGETLVGWVRAVKTMPRSALAFPPESLLSAIIAAACEGLHAAHETVDDAGRSLGIVHRDVSPQNLFVTHDGHVKVVDFGVAKSAGTLHQTIDGQIVGKVGYMSPEQVRAEPTDRRADVWALGVVLWEILTKQRLFRADSLADAGALVLTSRIRAPSELEPAVSPELDAIVLKALAREPADRYATARELGRALRAHLHSRGDAIGPPEIAEAMDALFPGGAARQQALLTQVDGGRDADPRESRTGTEPIPAEARSVSREVTVAPRRARGLTGVMIGLFAVAAVASGAVLLSQGPRESDASARLPRPGPAPEAEPAPPEEPEDALDVATPIPTPMDLPVQETATASEPVGDRVRATNTRMRAPAVVEPSLEAPAAVEPVEPAFGQVRLVMRGECNAVYSLRELGGRAATTPQAIRDVPLGRYTLVARVSHTEIVREVSVESAEPVRLALDCPTP